MQMRSYSRKKSIFRREIVENFLVSNGKKIFSSRYVDLKFFKRVLSDEVLSGLSFGSTETGLACQLFFRKNDLSSSFEKFSLFHEIST